MNNIHDQSHVTSETVASEAQVLLLLIILNQIRNYLSKLLRASPFLGFQISFRGYDNYSYTKQIAYNGNHRNYGKSGEWLIANLVLADCEKEAGDDICALNSFIIRLRKSSSQLQIISPGSIEYQTDDKKID
ncbi:hypothetical protein RCL_jg13426.t1 [Rhizophagus clarus]|uniref:Uncharacterized protein n=1 Tax=Rhizophagus clarus TaxID=94130 RepID=A0A8H3LKL0_9GLOM|nr:hypothetical protein RCL_jg13426.t1 [Rhizophagus clarus]